MRRSNAVFTPPPPMAVPASYLPESGTPVHPGGSPTTSSPLDGALSPSIIITVLVLATSIIVSASIYLLLRCLSVYCNRRRSSVEIDVLASDSVSRYHHSHESASRVAPESSSIIDSLPLFPFASISGSNAEKSGGDCAVCLSKFEPQDQLRLLPICCHAFHADCIDAWLSSNQTCPLCRSSILLSETEVMSKILSATAPNSATRSTNGSGSFRVEIGSISHRNLASDSGSDIRRSFSIGSFDYIVDDSTSEVTIASTHRRPESAAGGDKSGRTDESDIHTVPPPGESSGGERPRGSWLKEYVDRMSWTPSFSLSFRSSGRFFTGSSRRTDPDLGDEISEMFRWLSGV